MAEHEPDQEPGAEHPRRTLSMIGHDHEETMLAEALTGRRPHHAWMLTGPQGVGKATLAYRAARRLLGAKPVGPRPLDAAADDPVVRRIDQMAHPDLLVIRRSLNDKGKVRREITADDARQLSQFFTLQPAEGGWRVAIVDALDDLNRNAANALLKSLEEPPQRAVILLVCHTPGAVLPTIRSRARKLTLRPLSQEAVRRALGDGADEAAVRLGDGRPGRAIALAAQKAGAAEASLDAALEAAARGRPAAMLQLGVNLGAGADTRAALMLWLMKRAAARAARVGQGLEAPEGAWLERLGQPRRAVAWANAYAEIGALEAQFSGLDMEASLAVSRAAGSLLKAAA